MLFQYSNCICYLNERVYFIKKVNLSLAVSLDSFIQGPNGEFGCCFTADDYGMSDFFKCINAIFTGRKSYELALTMGGSALPGFPSLKEYVFRIH